MGIDLNQLISVVLGGLISSFVLFIFTRSQKEDITLNPDQWVSLPLRSINRVSSNTAIYRFSLKTWKSKLGLPIGQHVQIKGISPLDGKETIRSYTPISSDDDKGVVDFMVKTYPTGNLSQFFAQLQVGDTIEAKGPKGQMKYHPGYCAQIGMIAGGTGITPMLQIIRAVLKDPKDTTLLSLIYANVNYDDILLKGELDELAEENEERFKVYYVLNNPPEGWKGGAGFVTQEMIQKHIPDPKKTDCKLLMCGPPPMMKAMKIHLDALQFEAPKTISKMEHQVFLF